MTTTGQFRDTGLKAVGQVPWGTHFCIFYETKQDLVNILIPYFKAGLTHNELCLWIVAPFEFLSVAQAKEALSTAVPEIERGGVDIVSHRKWFSEKDRTDTSQAISRLRKKLAQAKRSGFSGLRLNGSSAWVRENLRARKFREFEHELDNLLANERMIVACTFPLSKSGAEQILDAARTHQFVVTLRRGVWKRVEIGDIESARKEELRTSPKLENLTVRQRAVLKLIAEGQNTKEIAAHLGLSVKTVEAHRVHLMRRLQIHNVPGLVRFAIRAGLVSA